MENKIKVSVIQIVDKEGVEVEIKVKKKVGYKGCECEVLWCFLVYTHYSTPHITPQYNIRHLTTPYYTSLLHTSLHHTTPHT